MLLVTRTTISQPISVEEAMKRAELYFAAHPDSPSAVQRPALIPRSGIWVALVGQNIQQSVIGLGATVEAALRAFDSQYAANATPHLSKKPRGLRLAPRSQSSRRGTKLAAAVRSQSMSQSTGSHLNI